MSLIIAVMSPVPAAVISLFVINFRQLGWIGVDIWLPIHSFANVKLTSVIRAQMGLSLAAWLAAVANRWPSMSTSDLTIF